MIDALTIPAEECYWARLPASTRGWTRDRILAAIEEWTPAVVDDLHVDWVKGGDGQILVLACEPARIEQLRAAHEPAWSMHPDRIPEHVAVPGVTPGDLNLLQGRFIPQPVLRADRSLRWMAVGVAVLMIGLLVAGTMRRVSDIQAGHAKMVDDLAIQLTAAIPVALGGVDPDPLLRLDQAERLMAGLHKAADGADGSGASALAMVLQGWPAHLRVQVETLAIDGNRFSVSGLAASVDDAQAVANALAASCAGAAGWRMMPLQATSNANGNPVGVAFTCTAIRERL